MSAMTQMNVRIGTLLKSEGDSVLSRFGITPTEFIRASWEYLAREKSIPAYMRNTASHDGETHLVPAMNEAGNDSKQQQMIDEFDEPFGLAVKLALDAGIIAGNSIEVGIDDEELLELSYVERGISKGWIE